MAKFAAIFKRLFRSTKCSHFSALLPPRSTFLLSSFKSFRNSTHCYFPYANNLTSLSRQINHAFLPLLWSLTACFSSRSSFPPHQLLLNFIHAMSTSPAINARFPLLFSSKHTTCKPLCFPHALKPFFYTNTLGNPCSSVQQPLPRSLNTYSGVDLFYLKIAAGPDTV